MFLPPKPGITIAESEGFPFATGEDATKIATSYCTSIMSDAPGSQLFYDEFFLGIHYQINQSQVQLTGRINASKAGIPLDGGGYYDLDNNVNSPPGGICAGYDSFYNFVSPIDGIFCIKCCKGIQGCQIWRGETGCQGMVPGNYEMGGFDGEVPRTGRILDERNEERKPDTPSASHEVKTIPLLWSALFAVLKL